MEKSTGGFWEQMYCLTYCCICHFHLHRETFLTPRRPLFDKSEVITASVCAVFNTLALGEDTVRGTKVAIEGASGEE